MPMEQLRLILDANKLRQTYCYATYSRPESMIVTIQSFRENRVLNSYVDSRKLQTMSCGITMVYMAIKRHILIQPPAAGAMIDNNITHTVTSQSIIPEEHILRPPTETHMADNNIMRIKQERSPCYTNSIPRSCLTCNSDIRSTDVYRGFQPDNTRNIEHNNTRTTGLTCLTQRSGPTVSQRIDHNYFSSTSTGSIGPSPFCPRERQVCCSLLNPQAWMPMVYKDVLE